jgi:hypothetical protein
VETSPGARISEAGFETLAALAPQPAELFCRWSSSRTVELLNRPKRCQRPSLRVAVAASCNSSALSSRAITP